MFKWLYRLQRKREEGFTLIELMVVVVILGILAAIAVPQLSGKSDQAKDSRARADLKVMESALELYYFDKNNYPDAEDTDEFPTALEGTYIKKVKADPWGNEYIYTTDNNSITTLYSKGRNGDGPDITYLD